MKITRFLIITASCLGMNGLIYCSPQQSATSTELRRELLAATRELTKLGKQCANPNDPVELSEQAYRSLKRVEEALGSADRIMRAAQNPAEEEPEKFFNANPIVGNAIGRIFAKACAILSNTGDSLSLLGVIEEDIASVSEQLSVHDVVINSKIDGPITSFLETIESKACLIDTNLDVLTESSLESFSSILDDISSLDVLINQHKQEILDEIGSCCDAISDAIASCCDAASAELSQHDADIKTTVDSCCDVTVAEVASCCTALTARFDSVDSVLEVLDSKLDILLTP